MRKYLFFLALAMAPQFLNAEVFKVGSLWYSFEVYEGRYEASVEFPPDGTQYSGDVIIPAHVIHDDQVYDVVSIGGFTECDDLVSVSIPFTVRSIGLREFYNCGKLEKITIAEANNIYDSRDNCNAVIESATNKMIAGCNRTTIPDGVVELCDYCFEGRSGLETITIPSSVIKIGSAAFKGCTSLTSVVVPDGVEWLYQTFEGCSALETVDIGDGVRYISWSAFKNCSNLRSIRFGKSLEYVDEVYTNEEDASFYGCTALEEVIYDVKNELIRVLPFSDALLAIKKVTIGPNVEKVQNHLFWRCTNLNSVTFEGDVAEIGERAFQACANLTSIEIPGTVKTIGLCAFSESGLKEAIIPEGVVTIDAHAFNNCENLEKVVIPSTVTTIGEWAFYDDFKLKTVVSNMLNPAEIDVSRFVYDSQSGSFTSTLYIPEGAKATYLTAGYWDLFEKIIDPLKKEPIKVSSSKQLTYYSVYDLDFTDKPELKTYVATGYDKASGTIWLTRVKEVPANTGFLLMGEADTYEIPVKAGGLSSYYQNMFKGTLEATTIYTTDGDYTNYYLSNGESGVGFYKVTKEEGVTLGKNRAYLPIPTEIPVVGTAGSTETIKVSAAGQVPYYNTESLDFSSLDAQGVKAYTATGYDYNSGTIWLTRVKQVPAKTGILIMAPEGEYPVPTVSVSSVYANMFRGTLEGTTIQTHEEIDGKDYINYYLSSGASGVGFYRVTKEEGVKIGANRCYLPILNKDAAAGTRSANSDLNQIAIEEADEVIGIQLLRGIGGDDDGTTSIKDLTPALSEGEGVWYTLQGQRVAKPGKGLYIRNGKKVVIK